MEVSKEIFYWKRAKEIPLMHVLMYLIINATGCTIDTSVAKLSEATGISVKCIRNILATLEDEGIITKISTNKATSIQIWRFFEDGKKSKKTKPKPKPQKEEVDLVSFVAPEHLAKWKEWLEYKKEIRSLYTTTRGAKTEYNQLLEISKIKTKDANGFEIIYVDNGWLAANIDYSILKNWKGLFQDKRYGNNNNYNNSGRTTQQDAERIAAQHLAQAAQPSLSAEENRRRIEEELRLFEQAQ